MASLKIGWQGSVFLEVVRLVSRINNHLVLLELACRSPKGDNLVANVQSLVSLVADVGVGGRMSALLLQSVQRTTGPLQCIDGSLFAASACWYIFPEQMLFGKAQSAVSWLWQFWVKLCLDGVEMCFQLLRCLLARGPPLATV